MSYWKKTMHIFAASSFALAFAAIDASKIAKDMSFFSFPAPIFWIPAGLSIFILLFSLLITKSKAKPDLPNPNPSSAFCVYLYVNIPVVSILLTVVFLAFPTILLQMNIALVVLFLLLSILFTLLLGIPLSSFYKKENAFFLYFYMGSVLFAFIAPRDSSRIATLLALSLPEIIGLLLSACVPYFIFLILTLCLPPTKSSSPSTQNIKTEPFTAKFIETRQITFLLKCLFYVLIILLRKNLLSFFRIRWQSMFTRPYLVLYLYEIASGILIFAISKSFDFLERLIDRLMGKI